MVENRFYEVVEPIRVWRQVGHSPSNHWVGSSRVIGTVREARNLRPGDAILLRPTGPLFAVHEGEAWVISLKEPAPFTARKLHVDRSRDLVLSLVAAGRLREVPEPATPPDPEAAVRAITANRLAPLHPETVVVEPSPELEQALSDVRDALGPWSDRGMSVAVAQRDSGQESPATVTLSDPAHVVEILAFPDGTLRVRFPESFPYEGTVSFRTEDAPAYVDARTPAERAKALEGIARAFATAQDVRPPGPRPA